MNLMIRQAASTLGCPVLLVTASVITKVMTVTMNTVEKGVTCAVKNILSTIHVLMTGHLMVALEGTVQTFVMPRQRPTCTITVLKVFCSSNW